MILNLPVTPEKMSPHDLVKCRTHSPNGRYIVSSQTLVALKRAGWITWQLSEQRPGSERLAHRVNCQHRVTLDNNNVRCTGH